MKEPADVPDDDGTFERRFPHVRRVIGRAHGDAAFPALVADHLSSHGASARGREDLGASFGRALADQLRFDLPAWISELSDFDDCAWRIETSGAPPPSGGGALRIAPSVRLRQYGHDFVAWIRGACVGSPPEARVVVLFWWDPDFGPRYECVGPLELHVLKVCRGGASPPPPVDPEILARTVVDMRRAGILVGDVPGAPPVTMGEAPKPPLEPASSGEIAVGDGAPVDVLLAVLPFARLEYPSIAASLLKAAAASRGFRTRVRYFNLDFAEMVGLGLYGEVVDHLWNISLLGEWMFASAAFGDMPERDDAYAREFLAEYPGSQAMLLRVRRARERCEEWSARVAEEIRAAAPRVVGFTCTYQQTSASLAVARHLKGAPGAPVVIFGGASCQGEMGLEILRSSDWVDYVCTGEGDEVFPAALERLAVGADPSSIPGILGRSALGSLTTPPVVRELDRLPIPDYVDYFEQLRRLRFSDRLGVVLPIEMSRGCWWGQKHHCTFCGFSGTAMAFRSKASDRALEELLSLSERYGTRRVQCVDNILDLNYLRSLFPRLAERNACLELSVEVKANLTYEQLGILRAAGVRTIQPGLESLSDEVLRLMQKGCTALQNIRVLRWGAELGMEVQWNIIYGLEGEPREEYARMVELIPLLAHLAPPGGCAPVRVDRFSPTYERAREKGGGRVRAGRFYRHVFPLEPEALSRLAFFFEPEGRSGVDGCDEALTLQAACRRWTMSWSSPGSARPRLDLAHASGGLVISDTRPCAVRPAFPLSDLEAEIYLLCDDARTPAGLGRALGGRAGAPEIQRILDQMLEHGLMVEMDGKYQSLAVFRHRRGG